MSVESDEVTDRDGWIEALNRLEADVAAAVADQGGLADDDAASELTSRSAAWSPPVDLGRIPDDLVERARLIAATQQEIIADLQAAVRSNRKHSAFVNSVPSGSDTSRAVYLDVAG